jgi:hypothetical protein
MNFQKDPFTGDKMIGYLTGNFIVGDVPKELVSKILKIENEEKIKFVTAGSHLCEYCQNERGNGDHYRGSYVWPEMLRHYISKHHYKPPQEFIDFIMNV